MRIFLALVFATFAPVVIQAADAAARIAPDSIAGQAYYDFEYSVGYATWRSIVFEDDRRFAYIWQTHNRDRSGLLGVHLTAPDPDGTYTFSRLDDTRATVRLTYADGREEQLNLTFITPTEGRSSNPASEHSFYMTDLAAWRTAPMHNISTRATALRGSPAIVGFIVPPRKPRQQVGFSNEGFYAQHVLIRAVGPSLSAFGIATPWADPKFQLYRNGTAYTNGWSYDDWSQPVVTTTGGVGKQGDPQSGFARLFSYVSAFPLNPGSKDAAGLFRLDAGAYTIVCDPADAGGDVLVEVYFLP